MKNLLFPKKFYENNKKNFCLLKSTLRIVHVNLASFEGKLRFLVVDILGN